MIPLSTAGIQKNTVGIPAGLCIKKNLSEFQQDSKKTVGIPKGLQVEFHRVSQKTIWNPRVIKKIGITFGL